MANWANDTTMATIIADSRRLAALESYDVASEDAIASLRQIIELAAPTFGASAIGVSTIDGQRETFRLSHGLDLPELPLANSLGAYAIVHDELVIPDATIDGHFFDTCPLVSALGIRSYAAVALRSAGGHPIGTVCVMDFHPVSQFPADRIAALHMLARLVETELERLSVTRRLREAEQLQRELAEVSSDLFWFTDAEHRFANFDTEAPGMAPLRPFALGRRRWEFRDSRPLHGNWSEHIAALESRQEFRDFEYELVTSLGDYRAMRISGRPVFDQHGTFLGYRGLSADITDQKLQERQLAASESKYRNLVESMVDVVFATDSSGTLTYVSGASKPVLGAEPANLVGRSFTSLIHPDDRDLLIESARLARGTPDQINSVVVRGGADSTAMRHVEVRFRATGDSDRVVFGGIIRDVEERTQMERRQHDDMMKLRSIVESSGALILLVDRDLRVVLANHSFLEATGQRVEEVVSSRMEDVIQCGIDPAVLNRWLSNDQPTRLDAAEYDNAFTGRDGTQRVIRATATPVQDDAGRVNYILFLGVDETARRSTELQLLDSARLATVGQMATGMAHEVNQPLTIIQFGIEGLISEVEDGFYRDQPDDFADAAMIRLRRMESQIKRASGIIRAMQGFASRSEKAQTSLDIRKTVEAAIDLVGEQMRVAGIELVAQLPEDLPSLTGQSNRLQQVLINLVLNARDAIGEGRSGRMAERGKIIVRSEYDKSTGVAVIEVEDNGPGIPSNILPMLFDPFFTTKPSGKGTGLGLSISSEIVRKMGGTLAAVPSFAGGACFRMTFPLAGEPSSPSVSA
jgi:PAS domain S-box-containing protein